MLYIVEKPVIKRKIEKFLNPDDEVITIFGKDGVYDHVIPESMPNNAASLDDLIKHNDLDESISFGVLDYFMAKAVLGKDGERFRKNLINTAKNHNKVHFIVDPDFMVSVANQLIKNHLNNINVKCSVDSVDDWTNESILKVLSAKSA